MSADMLNNIDTGIRWTLEGKMLDIELNELVIDFSNLVHDLDLYLSADTSEETYKKSVIKFKQKWFKRSDNKNEYKRLIDKRCKETAEELKDMVQYLYEDVL